MVLYVADLLQTRESFTFCWWVWMPSTIWSHPVEPWLFLIEPLYNSKKQNKNNNKKIP